MSRSSGGAGKWLQIPFKIVLVTCAVKRPLLSVCGITSCGAPTVYLRTLENSNIKEWYEVKKTELVNHLKEEIRQCARTVNVTGEGKNQRLLSNVFTAGQFFALTTLYYRYTGLTIKYEVEMKGDLTTISGLSFE